MAVVVSDEEGGSRRSTDEQEGGRTTPLPTATATTMTATTTRRGEGRYRFFFARFFCRSPAQPSQQSSLSVAVSARLWPASCSLRRRTDAHTRLRCDCVALKREQMRAAAGGGAAGGWGPAAGSASTRPPAARPVDDGRRKADDGDDANYAGGRFAPSLPSLSASPSASPLSPEIGGRRSPDGRTDGEGRDVVGRRQDAACSVHRAHLLPPRRCTCTAPPARKLPGFVLVIRHCGLPTPLAVKLPLRLLLSSRYFDV